SMTSISVAGSNMRPAAAWKLSRFDHMRPVCARRFSRYQFVRRRNEDSMATGLLTRIRDLFDGDPGVRKVADDPALTAELLLLFRMILADGTVSESEMAVFRHICEHSFGISGDSLDGVVEYLNDFGYETTSAQAIAIFGELDAERRKRL